MTAGLLLLVSSMSFAGDAADELAAELIRLLPSGVTAEVAYRGTEHEMVKLRWSKPFIVHTVIINGPPGERAEPIKMDDPVWIQVVEGVGREEAIARLKRHVAVQRQAAVWRERLGGVPIGRGKDWGLGGPEEWLRALNPGTPAQRALVDEYRLFLDKEYIPAVDQYRKRPDHVFRSKFVQVSSFLDDDVFHFDDDSEREIKKVLTLIEANSERLE